MASSSPMPLVVANIVLKESDVRAGQSQLSRLVAVLIVFDAFSILPSRSPTHLWPATLALLLFASATLVARFVTQRWLNSQPDAVSHHELEVHDVGVLVRGRGFEQLFPWSGFRRWRETQEALVLNPKTGQPLVWPKRCFTLSSLERLRPLLMDAVGRPRSRPSDSRVARLLIGLLLFKLFIFVLGVLRLAYRDALP